VIGIGAATWDRFLVVPHYPRANEKVRAIREEESAGGTMATALVALRQWGLRCRFVGILGFDYYSQKIIDDLTAEQIELDAIVRREDADGRRSLVLVDNRNGERSIVSGPHRIPPINPNDLPDDLFSGARVLHLDTFVDECGVEAATRAKRAGLYVTLDAEMPQKRTLELMPLCDYIIAPLPFAVLCTGETKIGRAAYALHLQTGRTVIVTDGAHGCELAGAEMCFHQPAYSMPVVDSTGAGDVFHAAFIYGLLAAWDLRKTLRFCAWAAATACRELGGRKGIPSASAVRDFAQNER
jgi:sugar/nucleoside kinase (ribokinase family)